MQAAEGVAKAGAKMLRGGAFKSRTSPYDFQGMEVEGLKLLQKGKKATGLAIITEVMSDRDVDLIAEYAGNAGGRAEHAEFRAAQGAGEVRATGIVEARDEQHDEGIADVGGIRGGARESGGDFVRAGNSHVRNGDAEYLGHCGDSGAERIDAPPNYLGPRHT